MNFIQANARKVIIVWVLFLIGFYLVVGYSSGSKLYTNKIESREREEERLDPDKTEKGKTAVDFTQLDSTNNYKKVYTGIYVDRIIEISTKATGWTVDFYVWFKWQSDKIHPGETFQVIDGEITSRNKVDEATIDGQHYALYRVTARITKFFNIVRYPLDSHLLTIRIEDGDHPWQDLRYVPDEHGAEYSSRVQVPGYRLNEAKIISKPHAYKTSRGDPRFSTEHQAVYSQITYGIRIDRPDLGLYFKMSQGLFASVSIAFLAFLFGPISKERISLGVGAFFASVASSYVNLSELPGTGMVAMVDMENGLAMITIFLTLLGSVISSHLARDTSQLGMTRKFDAITLLVFVVGFFSVNGVMAFSAST